MNELTNSPELTFSEEADLTARYGISAEAIRAHNNGRELLTDAAYKEHLRDMIDIMTRLNRTSAGPKATPAKKSAAKKPAISTDPMDLFGV
jgi:Zn-dependent peptidase ImmA (M78 family)